MALDLNLRKGALHRALHIPEGQKIPRSRLEEAAKSSNKLLAKRARLALSMRGWKKGKK
jgi:hypothetical protein